MFRPWRLSVPRWEFDARSRLSPVALCYCRTHRRVLSPALAAVADDAAPPALGRLVKRFDDQIDRLWRGQRLAA